MLFCRLFTEGLSYDPFYYLEIGLLDIHLTILGTTIISN